MGVKILNKKIIFILSLLTILTISIGVVSASDVNLDYGVVDNSNDEIISISVDDENLDNEVLDGNNITNDSSLEDDVNNSSNENLTGVDNTDENITEEAVTVSVEDLMVSASDLKNYVNSNKELPSVISIGGVNYTIAQFTYLIAVVIKNIDLDNFDNIIVYNMSVDNNAIEANISDMLLTLDRLHYMQLVDEIKSLSNQSTLPAELNIDSYKIPYNLYSLGFADILVAYKTGEYLPSLYTFNSSVFKKEVPVSYVTLSDVLSAASSLKSYIIKNNNTPSYIKIANTKVSLAQFSYLMSVAIKNINAKKTSSKIKIIDAKVGTVKSGFVSKTVNFSTILSWAKNVSNCLSTGSVPSYVKLNSSNVQFNAYTYAFAKVLAYYKTNKKLPKTCAVENFISTNYTKILLGSNSLGKAELIGPIGNKNSSIKIAFCIGMHVREYQVHNALYQIMNDKNHSSMNYCYYIYKISLANVTGDYSKDRMNGQLIAQKFILPHAKNQNYDLFLDMHSTSGTSYKYSYFVHVPGNKDSASMKFANAIVSRSPGMIYWSPSSQTSPKYLVTPLIESSTPCVIFETLSSESYSITYNRVLSYIAVVDKLFEPKRNFTTISEVMKEASNLKSYISTNKALPNTIYIAGNDLTPAQFSYIMAIAINNINLNKSDENISINFEIINGTKSGKSVSQTLSLEEYLSLVNEVYESGNTTNTLPGYLTFNEYSIDFNVYTSEFAKILDYYKNNNRLPNTCLFTSDDFKSATKYVTLNNILTAAKNVKSYMDKNKKKLPATVTVGSYKVSIYQFSYLMSVAIQNINANKISSKIAIINVSAASSTSYKISKSVKKSSYVTLAKNVANYMKTNKKAPNYATISSSKASFKVYTYSFSSILNYYKSYKKLPSSCSFKS